MQDEVVAAVICGQALSSNLTADQSQRWWNGMLITVSLVRIEAKGHHRLV